ncbi:MAG: hypothetical protein MUF48_20475 [Pirellulaceae bacterium]|jgi:hypothetical protein|nr:hypothetical protein [Pirellulaceae bacterium]
MQRNHILTVLLSLLYWACGSPPAPGTDESKEPPLEFAVIVDDKSVTINEGQTIQLDGTFTNPRISVTPQPYRVFPYQGITFKYPRSFTFEADLADPDAKHWTLTGNDLTIMFFVMNARLTTGEFANNMIDQFGRENCKVNDANAKITLGSQSLSGTSIQVTVATHKMVMDIYRIPSRGEVTKLLVFQDSLDDTGNRSKEGRQTLEDMKASFTVDR